ncbi:hypothetical protein [Bradyrhizobium genosp. P]
MRKLILITAMVLASASARAGDTDAGCAATGLAEHAAGEVSVTVAE